MICLPLEKGSHNCNFPLLFANTTMTFLSYIYVCQQSVNTKHVKVVCWPCLPTSKEGKDIVFRFIIEYSSLRDFYRPLDNNNNNRSIFIWGFLKHDIFGLCWNLRSVIELWYLEGFLVSFRGFLFFWRLYFCMVKYLNFHNSSSFALRYFFNVNGKAIVWHTPLL